MLGKGKVVVASGIIGVILLCCSVHSHSFPTCEQMTDCSSCVFLVDINNKTICAWNYLNGTCGEYNKNTHHVGFYCPTIDYSICNNSTALEAVMCTEDEADSPFDPENCLITEYLTSPSCLAGFYQDMNDFPSICCPGYFCPQNQICMAKCDEGAYCPAPDTIQYQNPIALCEPFADLLPSSLYYLSFISPDLGCGGAPINMQCPEGSYCPNASSIITCPSGSYCRAGSIAPKACPFHPLVSCAEGTAFPKLNLIGILFLFLLILVPRILLYVRTWYQHRKNKLNATRPPPKKGTIMSRVLGRSGSLNVPSSPIMEEEGNAGVTARETTPLIGESLVLEKLIVVDIAFQNLGLKLKGSGKPVLAGVTGELKAGRVTAVMGPSGAGKTTFLATLSGKAGSYGTTTGSIFLNGVEDSIANYKDIIGFVPQEDIMHRTLSVREILLFNARMRLGSGVTRQNKVNIVDRVINMLGLWEIQDSIIGDETERGISGGQRKRVNIGMELVANPSVLFLDEPTSGLDSTTSQDVLKVLKRVASVGVNVIVVLHQPRFEIFEMFDDVLLLGKGGQTVYLGPTNEALPYFESLNFELPRRMNPADFFMDAIAGEILPRGTSKFDPDFLQTQWMTYSENNKKDIQAPLTKSTPTRFFNTKSTLQGYKPRSPPNFLYQTFLMCFRALVQQSQELHVIYSDAIMTVCIGLVLGVLYRNFSIGSIPTVAFLVALVCGMAAVQTSLRNFGAEKPVFWRESSSGINRLAYFLGKNLAVVPQLVIFPSLFLLFFYSLSQPRGFWIEYLRLLLLLQWACSGLGIFISIIMSPQKASLAAVIITLVFAILSGNSPSLRSLRNISVVLVWATYVSYARWMMEALVVMEATKNPPVFEEQVYALLSNMTYDESHFPLVVYVLAGMGLAFRISAFFALIGLNRDKQK